LSKSEPGPEAKKSEPPLSVWSGEKAAVTAASKQQRLLPIVRIGLDGTQENDMVAAIIPIGGAALKGCNTACKKRRVAKTRLPLNPGKFVVGRYCEFACERLLRCAEDVD